MCYDESLLDEVYKLLEKYDPYTHSRLTFDQLMQNCFHDLQRDLESEEEYQNSDEAIIERIQENDYEFTEDGELI